MAAQSQAIFVSYTHESPEQKARVGSLVERLRSDGLDVVIDQDQTQPAGGWPLWTALQIRDAAIVLVICTREYYNRSMSSAEISTGLGARWEGHLILSYLYQSGMSNQRFIPVVFAEHDRGYIPDPLRAVDHYLIYTDYDRLLTRLVPQEPRNKTVDLPPPNISEQEAVTIADALLPSPYGLQAKPFRNRASERNYILVLRDKVGSFQRQQVILLEHFAAAWRTIWTLEPDFFRLDAASLRAEDIDGDGWMEIIVREWEESQVMVQERLNFYSIARRRLFKMTQSRRVSGVAYQSSSDVEIAPDDDHSFVSAMEIYASSIGFLRFQPLPANDSRNKLLRWLAGRGETPGGEFTLEFAPKYPQYGQASALFEATVRDEVYVAFFKGPMYCYQREHDRHFVVFVTNSQYDWVKCYAVEGTRIWFGIGNPTLFCFEHDDRFGYLRYAMEYRGEAFPDIDSLSYDNGSLVINEGTQTVSIAESTMTLGLPRKYSALDE